MGAVSSRCKPKRTTRRNITLINDQSTQTMERLPHVRDDFQYIHDRCVPSDRHVQRYPFDPSYSTGFNTFSRDRSISRSNPHVTKSAGPRRKLSIGNNIRKTTAHDYENWSVAKAPDYPLNESNTINRSNSVPLDMFLIDFSNRQVRLGEPIAINIRHLLLNKSDESLADRSKPISAPTRQAKIAQAKEELIKYIPNVCEQYPNTIVEPNRQTRHTLHASVPSRYLNEMN